MMQLTEISNEYRFHKFNQGIKIAKPKLVLEESHATISHLFSQNFNVYLVNNDYSINKINETCAAICGFNTTREGIGKTAFDFADVKSATYAQRTDRAVLS